MNTYVVTAYRWGQRNAHSYVVGAFPNLDDAKKCADAHVDYRGGKYGCEVVEAGEWSEDGNEDAARQVYYAECPYYGMAGDAGHFHPADAEKWRAGKHPTRRTRGELESLILSIQSALGTSKDGDDLIAFARDVRRIKELQEKEGK